MKLCLLSFLVFSYSLYAQDMEDPLVSRYRPGAMWFYHGIKPAEVGKTRKYDRLIFDIHYNTFLNKDQKLYENQWNSIGFNVSLMKDMYLSKNGNVSLGLGLSYGLHRTFLNELIYRDKENNSTQLNSNIKNYGYNSHLFKFNELSIPFELRFRGKEWKHAKIHLGAKLNYFFLPSNTLKSIEDKLVNKWSSTGFFDFRQLSITTFIRFGIRIWALYASYTPMTSFSSKESTQLNPLQLGLSIALF